MKMIVMLGQYEAKKVKNGSQEDKFWMIRRLSQCRRKNHVCDKGVANLSHFP